MNTVEPAAINQPHGKKLRKIVKPEDGLKLLKTVWLAGHGLTLVFGTLYSLYYMKRKTHGFFIPWLSYKLALVGVWMAYTISIQTQYNIKSLPSYSVLIATENFQYLLLSVVWFFNRNSLFKILPFMVVSMLQLAQKFKMVPILKLQKQLSALVLYNELFLFFLLFVDTLLLRGTSGYGLVLYCMFMWLRLLQSENTRMFLYSNIIKFDGLMAKIKNPKVQHFWTVIKTFLSTKQARFEDEYLS